MATVKPLLCACCGSVITAPQFYKGNAYGYTCILKVAPSYKRSRDTGLWITVDQGSEKHERLGDGIFIKSTCTINGLKIVCKGLIDRGLFIETGEVLPSKADQNLIKSGMLRLAKFNNGTDGYFSNLEIIQSKNKKGKLIPTSIVRYTGDTKYHFMDL